MCSSSTGASRSTGASAWRRSGRATIPWTVDIVGAVNRVAAGLREIEIRKFDLIGGSQRLQLELGRLRADIHVKIVGGSRTIRIERPTTVVVGEGVGGKGGSVTLDSRGWAAAKDRYIVDVVGGSKSIDRQTPALRHHGHRPWTAAVARPLTRGLVS